MIIRIAALVLLLSSFSFSVCAQSHPSITFDITDAEGTAVRNSVITLTPTDGKYPQDNGPKPQAIMNQIDKQFVPHVLVVQTNTEISFPNADNLFHHVYSFSPTKQFELKLYKEFTAEPLLFEAPGVVDIGCNIHDWMLGYIVVSDSPYFVKTDENGQGSLQLPKGEYTLTYWHPEMQNAMPFASKTLTVTESTTISASLDSVVPSNSGFDDGFGDY